MTLEAYSPNELGVILQRICRQQMSGAEPSLSKALLEGIFGVHQEVQKLVLRREIGRLGGPYEFNLRDLTKVRDVIHGA